MEHAWASAGKSRHSTGPDREATTHPQLGPAAPAGRRNTPRHGAGHWGGAAGMQERGGLQVRRRDRQGITARDGAGPPGAVSLLGWGFEPRPAVTRTTGYPRTACCLGFTKKQAHGWRGTRKAGRWMEEDGKSRPMDGGGRGKQAHGWRGTGKAGPWMEGDAESRPMDGGGRGKQAE